MAPGKNPYKVGHVGGQQHNICGLQRQAWWQVAKPKGVGGSKQLVHAENKYDLVIVCRITAENSYYSVIVLQDHS